MQKREVICFKCGSRFTLRLANSLEYVKASGVPVSFKKREQVNAYIKHNHMKELSHE